MPYWLNNLVYFRNTFTFFLFFCGRKINSFPFSRVPTPSLPRTTTIHSTDMETRVAVRKPHLTWDPPYLSTLSLNVGLRKIRGYLIFYFSSPHSWLAHIAVKKKKKGRKVLGLKFSKHVWGPGLSGRRIWRLAGK